MGHKHHWTRAGSYCRFYTDMLSHILPGRGPLTQGSMLGTKNTGPPYQCSCLHRCVLWLLHTREVGRWKEFVPLFNHLQAHSARNYLPLILTSVSMAIKYFFVTQIIKVKEFFVLCTAQCFSRDCIHYDVVTGDIHAASCAVARHTDPNGSKVQPQCFVLLKTECKCVIHSSFKAD